MCDSVGSRHHLLLDFGTLSTTNVKMKTRRVFAEVLIIGLLSQFGLAETNVPKGRVQRQAYLPPSSSNVISEEIITIHEEGPNSHAQFDESSYGGGKYQVFEVHNHYQPSVPNVAQHATDYSAPGYLPPEQEIRVKHIYQEPTPNVNHLDVSSTSYADGSSSSGHHGNHLSNYQQPIQVIGANVGPAEKVIRVEHFHISQLNGNGNGAASTAGSSNYLPPQKQHQTGFQQPQNVPQYTLAITQNQNHVESRHHNHHEQQYQQQHHHQTDSHLQVQQNTQFQGPDYLPPHQSEQNVNHNNVHYQTQPPNQFDQPGFSSPPQSQHHHHSIQPQNQFRGPDYLPPLQTSSQHSQHQVQQIQHQQQNQFRGPDYLPPHQSEQNVNHNEVQHQAQQSGQFKGPDYLPPYQSEQHHHHNDVQHHVQQQTQFKGSDYLPPLNYQQQNIQQPQTPQPAPFQSQNIQSNSFRGPDYLPPHDNGHRQDGQIAEFKAPEYLPPLPSTNQPGTLPPGYDFSKPEEQNIPPQPLAQAQFQQPVQQSPPVALPGPTHLPPGYDFEKPANAEAAIAELHTLPKEDDDNQDFVVHSQMQVGQNEQQAPVLTGQQQSSVNFQANGYLPPHTGQQQGNTDYQVPQDNVRTVTSTLKQVSPQIFSPAPAVAITQTPVSNYLPPARPVQAEQYSSNLHSLSSYMSNVQPNIRYGVTQFSAPQQPFREYGPPKPPDSTAIIGNTGSQYREQQQQLHGALSVAPMYNSQASRAPYYAPAMSYATMANSYTIHTGAHQQTGYQNQQQQQHHHHHHHATFNHQTKLNLQQFMPQDVRQSNPNPITATAPASAPAPAPAPRPNLLPPTSAVPVRQSTSGRVRTVQILNPSTVKTLKVLETSDHAGVKTIKILGPSQTEPTGDHRIVKVVTQNSNSPHEHVQTVKIYNDHIDAPIGQNNAYLPPVVRTVRQSSQQQKKQHQFTGRRRYRN